MKKYCCPTYLDQRSTLSYSASNLLENMKRATGHTAKRHCRKFETIISKKGNNFAASVPISEFRCLWAIYIYSHNRSAYSAAGKYVDRSWEYKNRTQTHECGNWDWGFAIPFLEIQYKINEIFVAVHCTHQYPKSPYNPQGKPINISRDMYLYISCVKYQ